MQMLCISISFIHKHVKKVKVSICIAHLAYTPLMRFSSLTRAAGRTATMCSLQTQAIATAG